MERREFLRKGLLIGTLGLLLVSIVFLVGCRTTKSNITPTDLDGWERTIIPNPEDTVPYRTHGGVI